ncbi:Positive regulator of purine utilization [Colletotrichum shisoi]|uniref:Positive regulator of purine utilization n=1 Tax=Colletotrichum shisoi TaxID=2078593 RepID=A0A5Q4BS84_9PEZI|nr:Positive regulator of purine utilization [Colletotrichum shisoi]
MADASNHRHEARQSRRNPRLRLACSRCQRRKIRCDGQLPACNNCKKAGVACTDGESVRLRDLPRAQIANLKERIRWLEGIVRERCPDVDLGQGPAGDLSMDVDGDEPFVPDSVIEASSERPDDTLTVTEQNAQITRGRSLTSPDGQQVPQPIIRSDPRLTDPAASSTLSHEIGLVSLGSSQDPKYIGPSSGYFLARIMLTWNPQDDQTAWSSRPPEPVFSIPAALAEAMHGPMPLPTREQAKLLAENYFDVVNCQFPILHQPTFTALLQRVYDGGVDADRGPAGAFQVFMVLALGSTVLSRRTRVRLPAESYCLSAMQYLDRVSVDSSIPGLQCLLLLTIFTMHSPNVRLNVWYLNYQCIAAVLDLGLQRDITTDSGISLLEQEMRTRIFWVVFSLDRMIATMMGRPIGLRDEACDLRLPQNIDDVSLQSQSFSQQQPPPPDAANPGRMAFSIHLFRLAKLNSEFKYVANSIVRDTPRYAYPAVIDIDEWQQGMLQQLDEWQSGIPEASPGSDYIRTVCRIRCHGLRMLVLRPSPAIPNPLPGALRKCYAAAREVLSLSDQLYKQNLLVHTWNTCHSAVLGLITMLYCIKMVPDIVRQTSLDVLLSDFSAGLGVLAATGEHWSGAKRCRDILDDMVRATVRWIRDLANQPPGGAEARHGSFEGMSHPVAMASVAAAAAAAGGASSYLPQDPFEAFLASTSFGEQLPVGDAANLDGIMRGLFDDFIPTYPNFS